MAQSVGGRDTRTMEQIREQYEIEKELAARLRNAPKQERYYLYSTLYDELFKRVPLHPLLTLKSSPLERMQAVNLEMKFLRLFVNQNNIFLEVGPGDCGLSLEMTKFARQVYAVDVSSEITKGLTPPSNFHLILSDGSAISVPQNSIDVAYSNQLMEHLHPDDAFVQLQNIYKALAPGGNYVCITPNRLNGPHDISRFFDKVATGFHLKEYTSRELSELFREVGFSKIKTYVRFKGNYFVFPASLIFLCEESLRKLPIAIRLPIARSRPFRVLLGIRLVGIK